MANSRGKDGHASCPAKELELFNVFCTFQKLQY